MTKGNPSEGASAIFIVGAPGRLGRITVRRVIAPPAEVIPVVSEVALTPVNDSGPIRAFGAATPSRRVVQRRPWSSRWL